MEKIKKKIFSVTLIISLLLQLEVNFLNANVYADEKSDLKSSF
jgi:hypothetical protein